MADRVYTRNELCPCGSGKKIKKCHEHFVGRNIEDMKARANVIRRYQDHFTFFRNQPEYMPPPDPATGWSRENWIEHGCPYVCENGMPACSYGTDGDDPCSSPGCGVGALSSFLAPIPGNLVSNPV